MEIKCFGSRKIPRLKYKAKWAGGFNKIAKQFLVSAISYLSNPFVKKKDGATKSFFEAIYLKEKIDDLIFDAHEHAYLRKVDDLVKKIEKINYIYDCGCGQGDFYKYALKQNVDFGKYIGIDFAIQSSPPNDDAEFVKMDLEDFPFCDAEKNKLVILCNVACYLSESKLKHILHGIASNETTLLIIDPIPGLFWDATFEQVKLFYRSPKKMRFFLEKYNFYEEIESRDYLVKIGGVHLMPLSYAAIYRYKEEENI